MVSGNGRDENLEDEKEEDGMTGDEMFAAEELRVEWMRGNRVRRQEDDSLINGSKTRVSNVCFPHSCEILNFWFEHFRFLKS